MINIRKVTSITFNNFIMIFNYLNISCLAASLMLTLQSMVRPHNFQTGLQHFVHRSIDICSFGETVTSDNFWVSLQEVLDLEKPKIDFKPPLKIENIAEIMRTWYEQPDIVPVIYVRRNYTAAPFEFKFMQV